MCPATGALLLGVVSQLLGLDGSSVGGVVWVLVRVRVVRWMSDDLVAAVSLAFEQLLQANDAGQDEGEFADDQGLERDEGQDTDGQWQEGGGLQFHQHEKWEQVLLALLHFAASCGEFKVLNKNSFKSF